MLFAKYLLKSSLDNFVLPGTLTGTEILWLYMVQWKRDLANVAIASLPALFDPGDLSGLERVESAPPENH